MSSKNKNIALGIALIASLLACISDIILLYVPNYDYFSGSYDFYRHLSPSRMILGHYLGIVCIPMQLLAVPWVSSKISIENKKEQLIISLLLFYTVLMGCIYHASCALIGAEIDVLENQYSILFEPIAVLFIIGLAIISIMISIKIFKGSTEFRKSLGLLNPICIAIIIYFIDYITSFNMAWATVAAFNLSILLFLCFSLLLKRNHKLND